MKNSPESIARSKAKDRADRAAGRNTARFILEDSRRSDKKKGLANDLTKPFINDEISKGCTYCGKTDLRMTLDRIDNSLGHVQSNVLPACIRCNLLRGSMPFDAWEIIAPAVRVAVELDSFGDWGSSPVRR